MNKHQACLNKVASSFSCEIRWISRNSLYASDLQEDSLAFPLFFQGKPQGFAVAYFKKRPKDCLELLEEIQACFLANPGNIRPLRKYSPNFLLTSSKSRHQAQSWALDLGDKNTICYLALPKLLQNSSEGHMEQPGKNSIFCSPFLVFEFGIKKQDKTICLLKKNPIFF